MKQMEQENTFEIELPIDTTLNITRLIEKAEQLAYDGKINNAAKGNIPVQFVIVDGKTYIFSVQMEYIGISKQAANE
jgi:hypothetical protein